MKKIIKNLWIRSLRLIITFFLLISLVFQSGCAEGTGLVPGLILVTGMAGLATIKDTQIKEIVTTVNLSTPKDITSDSATINWSISHVDGFAGYRIYHSLDSDVKPETSTLVTTITDNDITTYTFKSLRPNTKYYFRVFTVNRKGTSAGSNIVNATTLVVSGDNFEPSAHFKPTFTAGHTGSLFEFDAGASSDTETKQKNLLMRWDFDGDGKFDTELYLFSSPVYHTFEKPGNYKVKLEIRDEGGKASEFSYTINVFAFTGNNPPTPYLTVTPDSGLKNESTFYFDASRSSDTEDSTANLLYRFDFDDDGNYDTSFSSSSRASYKYPSAGEKTTRVEVKDGGNLTATTTIKVFVDASPIARFTRIPEGSVSVRTPILFDASTTEDEIDSFHSLVFRWDFDNDGIWEMPFGSAYQTYHTYTKTGDYTVVLQVMDPKGFYSEATSLVTVTAQGPVAQFSITPDSNITTDTFVIFNASSSSDPDGSPNSLRFRWDFNNDGTWDTTESYSSTASFRYTVPGNYEIKLMVTDYDNISTTLVKAITVNTGDTNTITIKDSSDVSGNDIGAITLNVGSSIQLFSHGYDSSNNYTGLIESSWSMSQTDFPLNGNTDEALFIGATPYVPGTYSNNITFTPYAESGATGDKLKATTNTGKTDEAGPFYIFGSVPARIYIAYGNSHPALHGNTLETYTMQIGQTLHLVAVAVSASGTTFEIPANWTITRGSGNILPHPVGGISFEATTLAPAISSVTLNIDTVSAPILSYNMLDYPGHGITINPGIIASVKILDHTVFPGTFTEFTDALIHFNPANSINNAVTNAEGEIQLIVYGYDISNTPIPLPAGAIVNWRTSSIEPAPAVPPAPISPNLDITQYTPPIGPPDPTGFGTGISIETWAPSNANINPNPAIYDRIGANRTEQISVSVTIGPNTFTDSTGNLYIHPGVLGAISNNSNVEIYSFIEPTTQFNTGANNLLSTITGTQAQGVTCMQFSHDRKTLYTATGNITGGTAYISSWNVSDPRSPSLINSRSFSNRAFLDMQWTPDGTRLCLTEYIAGGIYIIDPLTVSSIGTMIIPGKNVLRIRRNDNFNKFYISAIDRATSPYTSYVYTVGYSSTTYNTILTIPQFGIYDVDFYNNGNKMVAFGHVPSTVTAGNYNYNAIIYNNAGTAPALELTHETQANFSIPGINVHTGARIACYSGTTPLSEISIFVPSTIVPPLNVPGGVIYTYSGGGNPLALHPIPYYPLVYPDNIISLLDAGVYPYSHPNDDSLNPSLFVITQNGFISYINQPDTGMISTSLLPQIRSVTISR